RNPVDRLISHYQHERRKDRTEKSFEDFIALSVSSAWPAEGDITYVRQRCAVPRGFYVDQLRHWQTYFPNQRFFVLSFEDLVKNTPATLNGVFEFLGLEQQTVDTSTVLNKGTGGKPPVITRDLRNQLEDLYRQKNAGLEGMTGRKFGWF
ncbi:MAG: sulfotransferase domain-containing protein, partial [Aestuariivirga sp.]